jgi:membrane protein required for colicin V production
LTADFNALDWILIVMVGASTLFGFRAGLARVVIGFIAGIIGIVAGFWFYQTPAAWFSSYFKSDTVAAALGFLIIFGGVILAGGILARMIAAIFRWAGLSWIDRLLGGVAGFLRGMLVMVGILTPLLAFAPDPMPGFLAKSQLLPYTMAFGHVIVTTAPGKVREQFEKKSEELKALWKGELHRALPQIEKAPDEKKVEPAAPGPPPPHTKPGPFKKESY